MKKIFSLCFGCVLMISLFTIGVSAASSNFSFYFNGAYVEGDENGVFYNITYNKAAVNASGNWHLRRANATGAQTAKCSISLRKSVWGLDDNYGDISIGSASVSNGYYQGPSESFDVSWTAGNASSKYYLVTACTSASGNTYKEGSGKLSW